MHLPRPVGRTTSSMVGRRLVLGPAAYRAALCNLSPVLAGRVFSRHIECVVLLSGEKGALFERILLWL